MNDEVNYVECLLCSHVYLERDTFIAECGNCGNRDTEQTIYLQTEVVQ